MTDRLRHTALFAAYQLVLGVGIMLLPVALALRRSVGVVLPINRILEPVRGAYDHGADSE